MRDFVQKKWQPFFQCKIEELYWLTLSSCFLVGLKYNIYNNTYIHIQEKAITFPATLNDHFKQNYSSCGLPHLGQPGLDPGTPHALQSKPWTLAMVPLKTKQHNKTHCLKENLFIKSVDLNLSAYCYCHQ